MSDWYVEYTRRRRAAQHARELPRVLTILVLEIALVVALFVLGVRL